MATNSLLHLIQIASGALQYGSENMPEFNAGDVPGWRSRSIETNGIEVYMFKTEPHSEYPIHSAPGYWIGYIVQGTGSLLLEDQASQDITSHQYQPGDIFYFEPDTPHGWKTGPEAGATLFIKVR